MNQERMAQMQANVQQGRQDQAKQLIQGGAYGEASMAPPPRRAAPEQLPAAGERRPKQE